MTIPTNPSIANYQLVGGLISSLLGAIGGSILNSAKNAALKSQANIARLNAQVMERRADATFKAGEQETVTQTMKAGKVKSSQKAALAANGVAIGEGSAAELTASTDIIKELDKNTIKKNTLSKAWGFKWAAVNYENQAIGFEGQMQDSGMVFATTLLSGASQAIGKWGLSQANSLNQTPTNNTSLTPVQSVNTGTTLGLYDEFRTVDWNSAPQQTSLLLAGNPFANSIFYKKGW